MIETPTIEDNGGPVRGCVEFKNLVSDEDMAIREWVRAKSEQAAFDQALEVVKARFIQEARRISEHGAEYAMVELEVIHYGNLEPSAKIRAYTERSGYGEPSDTIEGAAATLPRKKTAVEILESEIAAKSAELAKLKGGAK